MALNLSTLLGRRQIDGDCWIWTGALEATGYARVTLAGERDGVHRWAYRLTTGPIPDGQVIDHLCNRPACFNPVHLCACSQRDNVLRSGTALAARNARKSGCLNGHPFDGQDRNGARARRRCLKCHAERERQRRQRVREG